MTTMNGSVRAAALELVEDNVKAEPALLKAYLFPADDEIRLVYVDATTSPLHNTDRIAPFYFGANKADGRPYLLAMALIRPEEDRQVPLPEGWGGWNDADVLWEKPQVPLDWRTAYLNQARSDHEMLLRLLKEQEVPQCHCLHYLQMTAEKMAKGFLTRPGRPYRRTHDAIVAFMQTARYLPQFRQACGFTQNTAFIAFVGSLLNLAQSVENLSPEGEDHPNPEYPWEQGGVVVSPLSHPFAALDLRHPSPQMVRLLKFIADCLTIS